MCTASHWNMTYWLMVALILDISTSIHQVYLTYCWNSNILSLD